VLTWFRSPRRDILPPWFYAGSTRLLIRTNIICNVKEQILTKPTVLIVEDEFLIRMHLVAVFEDAGCCSIEASSADEAISMLEIYPSLKAVVTDIRMPGQMDGLALAHYVASNWPDRDVVVCSGNELPLKRDLPEGARFLAKPVQFALLSELAAELCRQ
jgi:CheY-like chemotaxis protein